MAASAPDPPLWGTCLYCGDAVPPDSGRCPICGAEEPLTPAQEKTASRQTHRRLNALRALRGAIVVLAIVGVCYLVISPVFSGPPVITDPLTTSGSYSMAPGNTTILAGEITGEDYVIGNFSVTTPYGLQIGLTVYNTTEYQAYLAGVQTQNQSWVAPVSNGRFNFPAPYTDTFYFVFYNPYLPGSGLSLKAYIVTTYTPNVNAFD